MTLTRRPDWRAQLGRIIESAGELEFQWGTFDCALHLANCVRAVTGVDPAASFRGTYSDEASAAAVYGSSFEQFIATQASALSLEEVAITFARRGDIVFIDNGTEQGCVGVIGLDARFASCASDKGLVLVPMKRWKRAWKVG